MTVRPYCPSCGHFKSHAPRTDSLSSGKCPDCSCLSGWQHPDELKPVERQARENTLWEFKP